MLPEKLPEKNPYRISTKDCISDGNHICIQRLLVKNLALVNIIDQCSFCTEPGRVIGHEMVFSSDIRELLKIFYSEIIVPVVVGMQYFISPPVACCNFFCPGIEKSHIAVQDRKS